MLELNHCHACVRKMKNTALGGGGGEGLEANTAIQHSVSPRAVLSSQHALSCCIFHTHTQRCFNYNVCTWMHLRMYAHGVSLS